MKLTKLLKQISKYSLATIVSTVVSLVVIPFITKLVPTDEYGKVTMFITIGNLIMSYCFLGIDNGLIRFYHDYEKEGKTNSASILAIGFGIAIVTITLIATIVIGLKRVSLYFFDDESPKVLWVLFIYSLSLAVYRITNIVSRMGNRPKAYNLQNIGQTFISRILIAFVIVFTYRYQTIVFVMCVGMVFLAIASLAYSKKNFYTDHVRLSKDNLSELIKYSIPLFPSAIILNVNSSIAKFAFADAGLFSELGIFSIALTIANIIAIIPRCFGVYWAPFVYENYEKEHDIISDVHDYVMLLSCAMILAVSLLQDVGFAFIGTEYAFSKSYFMLLMLYPLEQFVSETTAYGITLTKKTIMSLVFTILSFLVNAVLCFALVPRIGQIGAAMGIAFSSVFSLIIKAVYAQKYYKTINNIMKSTGSFIIIVVVCVSNIWLGDMLIQRIIVDIILSVLLLLLHNGTITQLVSRIRKERAMQEES